MYRIAQGRKQRMRTNILGGGGGGDVVVCFLPRNSFFPLAKFKLISNEALMGN